jgi:PKD repeat protein
MTLRKINNKMTTITKGLILGLLIFANMANEAFSQGFQGKYEIVLIGQIMNDQNGAPIKNHMVHVSADTSYTMNFSYNKTLFTDGKGFFYDTINTDYLKGGLIISTKDYLNSKHDTTVYFRFKWSDSNTLFANFELPVLLAQTAYQARFKYLCNPFNNNPFDFAFIDLTNSTEIVSWEWNFGDGHYSNQPNPNHLYANPGVFRVTLKVKIETTFGAKPVETSIEKLINVRFKSYYHLGGHIFAGYFPVSIDTGFVYLYKVGEKDIEPIDTAYFNEDLGYYSFFQLIDGEYFVKADIPESSSLYLEYFPTYYSNELFWTEADTIFHNAPNYDYNIHLVPVPQSVYGSGPGSINGTIHFDPSGKDASPACDAEILLLDENGDPLTLVYSDEEGEFGFGNLELTSFKVFAEVTGKITDAIDVTLDENNPEVEDIEIVISSNTVNGSVNGISDLEWGSGFGDVYPNPVSETASIWIELSETTEIQIEIYNNLGQIIKETNETAFSGESTIHINLGSQKSGVYFLRISEGNRHIIKKFVKK